MRRPRKRPRESRENDADSQEPSWIPSPSLANPKTAVGAGGTVDESSDSSCKRDQQPSAAGRGYENPVRAEDSERSTQRRHSKPNIHDFSFILHPSHERSDKEQTTPSTKNAVDSEEPILVARACYVLGVTQTVLEQM